jgi:predicted ATP-binding protein involved in virulence
MHIQTLKLTNFRGARSLSLDLHEQLNVLVGVNGAGKSTVLDASATMLSWVVSRIRQAGTSGRHISEEDITNKQWSAAIDMSCVNDNQKITWRLAKSRKGYGSREQPSDLKELSDYTKQIQTRIANSDQRTNIPLFVHYPVTRAVLEIPLRIRGKHTFELLAAYDNALTTGANFRTFFEWFREREDLENEVRVRKSRPTLFEEEEDANEYPDPHLQAVRNALGILLPEFRNLTVRRNPLRMEIEKKGEVLTVNQLSDGEKCVIAMVSDLARRLAIANPTMANPLHGDGIILIDEIDLHLHPKWQRMIANRLLDIFPNCQFIVSTHSPHVLTHVHPENILILHWLNDSLEALRPEESYGRKVDRILEDLMELDTTRPEEVDKAIRELFNMISLKKSDEMNSAREVLNVIKQRIGDDPELIKAEGLIRRKELIGK